MRVLLIANYKEEGGGISVQVKLLRDKLSGEGIDCKILSTTGTVLARCKAVCSLLIRGGKYDVLHVHACSGKGFFPAVVGISIGRLLHKRIILTYHGGGAEVFFKKRTRLVRHFLKKTSVNIVLSGFIGQVFERYGLAYTVLPNIIEWKERGVRTRESVSPDYISIRALSDTYNIECTIRAFESVVRRLPEATLTVLGDGPSRESLVNMVRVRNIPHVSFVGQVKNEDIYQYLDKADVMVSSSRFDNMPVSILEGFNAGLLVVASRVGGVPFMIEDGVNGLLFDDDDAEMMADRMLFAMENQARAHEIIEAEKRSLEKYRWDHVKEQLLDLYNGNL